MKKVSLAFFILTAALVCSAEKILFEENFNRFDPGKNSGLTGKDEILEENGVKFQRAPRYSWMFGDMNYFKANLWSDYVLTFDFRFNNPKFIGALLILKQFGKREAEEKYNYMNLGIGSNRAGIDYHGSTKKDVRKDVKYKDLGMPDLKTGVWYRAEVDVAYRHIVMKLTDTASGKTWTLFDCDTLPGGGALNLCAYNESRIDIANLKVVGK